MLRLWVTCLLAGHIVIASAEDVINPNPNQSSPDPWQLLTRAAQAARDLSYKGIFTYQSAGYGHSVEITHMNNPQGEYARAIMLDGTPRELFAQGRDVIIFSPKNQKVLIEKRRGKQVFPAILPNNLDVLKGIYTAKILGEERVGGREGVVVYLEAKDQFRYHYKLSTDKEFGILLKVTAMNPHLDVVEQVAFNQLNLFNTQDVEWFKPKLDQQKSYVMDEAPPSSVENGSDDWQIASTPSGYKQVDHYVRRVPGKPVPVNQFIFTDGLSSVSLFIEPIVKGIRPKVGKRVMGATSMYAGVANGYQVMAVGEVPQETVQQFVQSVTFKK